MGFDSFRDEGVVLVVRLLYSNTVSYTPLLEWVLAEWGLGNRPRIETALKVRRVRGKVPPSLREAEGGGMCTQGPGGDMWWRG